MRGASTVTLGKKPGASQTMRSVANRRLHHTSRVRTRVYDRVVVTSSALSFQPVLHWNSTAQRRCEVKYAAELHLTSNGRGDGTHLSFLSD